MRELTSRMRRGDEPAYREFYDRFCDRLFRYLLVMTRGDEARSRDLLQAVLIKVVRHLKPFDDEAVCWGWLTRLARTAFIDELRRQARSPKLVAFPGPLDLGLGHIESVTERDSAPLLEALEESLFELDSDERDLIRAAYFEQATHRQVADRSATTPKAIESRLARIRHKLRKLILGKLKHETYA